MKRVLLAISFGFLTALIHLEVFYSTWGERLEMFMLDYWFNLRGTIQAPKDIIIAAIDEDSYEELDVPFDKAWPRALHAKLLERFASAGVKRAAFDVLFLGPSDSPEADAALAKSFSLFPTAIGADQGQFPYELFLNAVEQPALVGLPEIDGKVRHFKSSRKELTQDLSTLSEAGAGIDYKTHKVPGPRDLINFYGPRKTIDTYSYYELLDPEIVEDEYLKDKIIFVGIWLRTDIGPAQKDSFITPFMKDGMTFGVEIHATAAGNMLSNNWIKRATKKQEGLWLSIAAFLLGASIFWLKPLSAALMLVLVAAGWSIGSYHMFIEGQFIPGALLSYLVLPVLYLGNTLYFYFVTLAAQRRTQKAFGFYLSPEMARRMSANPEALKPGGEKLVATAMFTDIEDFTGITEPMPSDEVARMLNTYFTDVMDVIFDEKGTLIKFIGDAVFALWGAPLKVDGHADKAVKTALIIQKKVKEFNERKEFEELNTRIGVHTGEMLVGNLGSNKRFDYTAIGDSVNFSARLEGLNKFLGTDILISEDTKGLLTESFNILHMGKIAVKGKTEAVSVYTVTEKPLEESIARNWEEALSAFAEKDFDKARELLLAVQKDYQPLQAACLFYIQMIPAVSKRTQFDKNWSGEIELHSK